MHKMNGDVFLKQEENLFGNCGSGSGKLVNEKAGRKCNMIKKQFYLIWTEHSLIQRNIIESAGLRQWRILAMK